MAVQDELDVPIHFLDKSDRYDTLKPYAFQYYPQQDFPRDNLLHSSHKIHVKSMRARHPLPSLESEGFEFQCLKSQMSYEDYSNDGRIENLYCRELEKHLTNFFEAKHVRALDYQIRRKLPGYPYFDNKLPPAPQPSLITHVDVTPDAAEHIVREIYDEATAEKILQQRYLIVTVWKPFRLPVEDWPLAICDANTVDEQDLVASDVLYPNWVAENRLVHYNAKQNWYWLPNHQTDEILVFKAFDSGKTSSWPCPHGAFPLPNKDDNTHTRESIDVRLLVMFADTDYPAREAWSK